MRTIKTKRNMRNRFQNKHLRAIFPSARTKSMTNGDSETVVGIINSPFHLSKRPFQVKKHTTRNIQSPSNRAGFCVNASFIMLIGSKEMH